MSEPIRIQWIDLAAGPNPKEWQKLVGRVGIDETGEIWMPARLLNDQDWWVGTEDNVPTILDDFGTSYIRSGWWISLTVHPRQRVRCVERVREIIEEQIQATGVKRPQKAYPGSWPGQS
jgi:hypothetical protein